MKKFRLLVTVLVLTLAVAGMTGCQSRKSPSDKISDGVGSVVEGVGDLFGK